MVVTVFVEQLVDEIERVHETIACPCGQGISEPLANADEEAKQSFVV
jgi:hypothetical protein